MARLLASLVVAICLTAAPAFAGIADSPIPAPFKHHVYSVSGVHHVAGILATLFSCTNADKAVVTIGVEVFSDAGAAANNVTATASPVGPGQTLLLVTQGVSGFSPAGSLGTASPLQSGSARILSTSKKIVCSVILAKTDGSAMVDLSLVAKTKQKGD